jgi:hypothetical protein
MFILIGCDVNAMIRIQIIMNNINAGIGLI